MPRRPKSQSLKKPRIEKLKKLAEEQTEAERVQQLLQSKAWVVDVQPLIDKMIVDTVGGVDKDGMWSPGIVNQNKNYDVNYLLGYRMALMDFNNRLRQKSVKAVKVKKQIEDLKTKKSSQVLSSSWSYMPVTTTLP